MEKRSGCGPSCRRRAVSDFADLSEEEKRGEAMRAG